MNKENILVFLIKLFNENMLSYKLTKLYCLL